MVTDGRGHTVSVEPGGHTACLLSTVSGINNRIIITAILVLTCSKEITCHVSLLGLLFVCLRAGSVKKSCDFLNTFLGGCDSVLSGMDYWYIAVIRICLFLL